MHCLKRAANLRLGSSTFVKNTWKQMCADYSNKCWKVTEYGAQRMKAIVLKRKSKWAVRKVIFTSTVRCVHQMCERSFSPAALLSGSTPAKTVGITEERNSLVNVGKCVINLTSNTFGKTIIYLFVCFCHFSTNVLKEEKKFDSSWIDLDFFVNPSQ